MTNMVVWESNNFKVGQDFVCPGSAASHLASLLLVHVLDVQDHKSIILPSSTCFVNFYLYQDLSGILSFLNK
jgi:hypothetical protein